MQTLTKLFIVITFYLFVSSGFAQTTHNININGMTFVPADLTIQVNDAVKWTNDGGFHNVLADDGSFTSGSPSSQIWEYTHTFASTGNFRYYCEVHGSPGGVGMAGIIRVEGATGVDDEVNGINFKLNQNYPNPFNPKTIIQYSISKPSDVTLKVFNVTGSLEKVLISEYQPVGKYMIEFNSEGLTSGVYFYQLIAGDFISTKRMILLK